VVNSALTNLVRFAAAALLGLAACLVAWWPQSASGSGDVANLSPVAAGPTQMTPTAAPPPPAPPPTQAPAPQPTKKPTKKPHQSSGGSNHHPTTLHNTGNHSSGNHSSGNHSSGSSHQSTSSGHTSTSTSSGSSGSVTTPYVAPTTASTPRPPAPTKPATSAPTKAPTTTAPAAPQSTEAAAPVTTPSDEPSDTAADQYDTYLSSSEPAQTTSAPVWVVPGILLVLTSMLALLGGVLGRGNRPVLARVRSSSRNDERPTPQPPAPEPPSMFKKPAPGPDTP
jgi:hypothetical protein